MSSNKVEPHHLRVQSIVYNAEPHHVLRAIDAMARSVQLAMREGKVSGAEFAVGDCSPFAIFDADTLSTASNQLKALGIEKIEYTYFDKNLGSAAGHNRLLESAKSDLILIQNPDVVAAPNLVGEMIDAVRLPKVGQVEARQIPIEHPKFYDPVTRETSWASTACSIIPLSVALEVGKFDSSTFFLYCDDVDFSWRVRLAGYRVLFQPSAVVFHDKRLSNQGAWKVGSAEKYYSAEAALLLAWKYSRPDLLTRIIRDFEANGEEPYQRAVGEYRKRKAEGRLPLQLDSAHRVAQFIDGNYAKHRF